MSQVIKTQKLKEKEGRGFLHHLFERATTSDVPSAPGAKSALDLNDIQGFILRGYKMPMVRHFLLTVGDPATARKLLGRLVSGDETDAPQTPQSHAIVFGLFDTG
jgi:hypothetical protein